MSMLLTTAAALSAALATEPVATPVATLSAPAPRPTLSEPAPVPEAPAATEGIRALLRARHTEDLPDRAVLDAHHGAEEVLQWLAQHGETLLEAERAAMLLAHYPTDASRAVCLAVLGGEGHGKVRAGAARCLATQQGDAVPTALVQTLHDGDLRVVMAGAAALRDHPGAIESLAPGLLDSLPPAVRQQLE